MDFFIIKNIVELKENKKIIIKNQNNVDFLNTYSFFEYLFDNYKEKKFLIFIIIKKNFFFCLPLSNFYYFKQEFYTFIGGPYISQERSILHNIKNINLFNLCLNKIFNRRYFMVTVFLEVRFEESNEIKSFQCSAKSTNEAYCMCLKKLDEYNTEKQFFSVLYILKAYN